MNKICLTISISVTHWYFEHSKYFNDGLQGQIYLKVNNLMFVDFLKKKFYEKNVDYVKSLKDLDTLVEIFENNRDVIKSVDSWHTEFKVKLF